MTPPCPLSHPEVSPRTGGAASPGGEGVAGGCPHVPAQPRDINPPRGTNYGTNGTNYGRAEASGEQQQGSAAAGGLYVGAAHGKFASRGPGWVLVLGGGSPKWSPTLDTALAGALRRGWGGGPVALMRDWALEALWEVFLGPLLPCVCTCTTPHTLAGVRPATGATPELQGGPCYLLGQCPSMRAVEKPWHLGPHDTPRANTQPAPWSPAAGRRWAHGAQPGPGHFVPSHSEMNLGERQGSPVPLKISWKKMLKGKEREKKKKKSEIQNK